MRSALVLATAAACLAGAAAAADTTEYVTPEILDAAAAPRFLEAAVGNDANTDDGTSTSTTEGTGDGETTTGETQAQGSGHASEHSSTTGTTHHHTFKVPPLATNEPTLRTPYTYDNSQPAYRSTYYRYPWMHEPFGRKPTELARFPIGSHVEFPWQREAREEYADEKLRERDEREHPQHDGGEGGPHLPHPLGFAPPAGLPPWANSYPFVHPGAAYPYYPVAHPEMHPFGFYGAGADVSAPLFPGGGHPIFGHHAGVPHPGDFYSAGTMDPRYSPPAYASAALLAATAPGADAVPYGAGWYGAGTYDIV